MSRNIFHGNKYYYCVIVYVTNITVTLTIFNHFILNNIRYRTRFYYKRKLSKLKWLILLCIWSAKDLLHSKRNMWKIQLLENENANIDFNMDLHYYLNKHASGCYNGFVYKTFGKSFFLFIFFYISRNKIIIIIFRWQKWSGTIL